MAIDEIIEQIGEEMIDVFDIDDLVATPALSAHDVAEWDSLSHIRLMVALERRFNIRFSQSDVEGLQNVGDLAKVIERKLS